MSQDTEHRQTKEKKQLHKQIKRWATRTPLKHQRWTQVLSKIPVSFKTPADVLLIVKL